MMEVVDDDFRDAYQKTCMQLDKKKVCHHCHFEKFEAKFNELFSCWTIEQWRESYKEI